MKTIFLRILFNLSYSSLVWASVVNLEANAHSPANAVDINRFKILDEDFVVAWVADLTTKTISFNITAKTLGFVQFGLLATRGMESTDVIIGGVKNGTSYFSDYHETANGMRDVDKSQDWKLLSASENETHTNLVVIRLLNTSDDEDVPINSDTNKFVWAIGATDDISDLQKRGSASVIILDPVTSEGNTTESDVWHINVKTILSAKDTTYWCTAHKSPFTTKRHMTGFKAKLESPESQNHTHHILLHRCLGNFPEQIDLYEKILNSSGGECYFNKTIEAMKQTCEQYVYSWAVGGEPLYLPENIGVPLNELDLPEYFLIEVHYDNPEKLSDLNYATGIEIYTTTKLRKHEAGLLRVGHEIDYTLMIPPNTTNFVIAGHCSGTCTKERLPKEGLNVFTAFMHSHTLGRKMKLRHFQKGVELPWISSDDNYDFNFQQNRLLPQYRKILQGDHLTIECTDDSSGRSPPEAVLGGLSTRKEMCLAFVMYYPRLTNLDYCGSYFSESENLFSVLGIEDANVDYFMDPVITAPQKYAKKLYSDVLSNLIPWNDTLKLEVQRMSQFGKHKVMCEPRPNYFKKIREEATVYPKFEHHLSSKGSFLSRITALTEYLKACWNDFFK